METEARYREMASQVLSTDVEHLTRLGGGRNSRVYQVDARDDHSFVLKFYFRHPDDSRDRLGTESASLTFLWKHGMREIPEPLKVDRELGCLVLPLVPGEYLRSEGLRESDIDHAVAFLAGLAELRKQPDSHSLGPASEARFSPCDVAQNIQQRLDKFVSVDDRTPVGAELRRFLDLNLLPGFAKIQSWSRSRLDADYDQELEEARRTLSPSDFGFHNAVRRADGSIVFLDFEYFGWDDPAKMICDFLLHPAMDIPANLKQRFLEGMLRAFPEFPELRRRVAAMHPLFGVKWCCILLNELLPEHWMRRQFAGTTDALEQSQRQQLGKAQTLWRILQDGYESFSD